MGKIAFFLYVCTAFAQTQPHYDEVYYQSGKLRIEAYLYKPPGNGPFPVVLYNHGSRAAMKKRPRRFLSRQAAHRCRLRAFGARAPRLWPLRRLRVQRGDG